MTPHSGESTLAPLGVVRSLPERPGAGPGGGFRDPGVVPGGRLISGWQYFQAP